MMPEMLELTSIWRTAGMQYYYIKIIAGYSTVPKFQRSYTGTPP